MNAYRHLTARPAKLVTFSDDMDGLRKLPGNIPNHEILRPHLGKPISRIPDPFGCCESFSGHMISRLEAFLHAFGFAFESRRASTAYSRGDFDEALSRVLRHAEEIKAIVLPTLSPETRVNWSPFMPICSRCGRVYSTVVTAYSRDRESLVYVCSTDVPGNVGCGFRGDTSIHGGAVKVGWKVDWALRWFSYGIDYEMYGKDLIPSAELSAKIVRVMGGYPPAGMFYEMFLDEAGKKISKSVGQGLTLDTWTRYAPIESLLHYIYQSPRKAKKLHLDVVPAAVDQYLDELSRSAAMDADQVRDTAVWHIHAGDIPKFPSNLRYTTVLNVLVTLGGHSESLLTDYLLRYDASIGANPPILRSLTESALNYFRDHLERNLKFRCPTATERSLLTDLVEALTASTSTDEEALQSLPFSVAKSRGVSPADYFRLFYEVVLGQERGPRFGAFAKMLSPSKLADVIRARLACAE
jgi:lysyl-tRNA synthetase class 1